MSDTELAYYRAVEDQFGRLRGTPFLFNPKDFVLLRQWWRDEVPLAAVFAGLGEVFERRRREGGDPVSSLGYCRHAVARHAKRLATARVGAGAATAELDVAGALDRLETSVREAAAAFAAEENVNQALLALASAIASIPRDADPSAADEVLAQIEGGSVTRLLAALPDDDRRELEREVELAAQELPDDPDVRERSRRAMMLRALRGRLGLPRLELIVDG